MLIKIIHCPRWKSYIPKVASYAAAIRKEFKQEPMIETGSRGQFDVFVNDELVYSRKGGLFAMITRKPWPTLEQVVAAILESKG